MEISVGDAMVRGVIYVKPKDNVQKVAKVMKDNDIESVIVIEKGLGAGIVTDTDIISKIVADGLDPRKTNVSDIMTSPLITIAPGADIDDAARKMRAEDIHRLVVTQGGKIVGIISEFDIVKVEPALHVLIREHSMWDIADLATPETTISGVCESCENYCEDLTNSSGRLLCEECIKER